MGSVYSSLIQSDELLTCYVINHNAYLIWIRSRAALKKPSQAAGLNKTLFLGLFELEFNRGTFVGRDFFGRGYARID